MLRKLFGKKPTAAPTPVPTGVTYEELSGKSLSDILHAFSSGQYDAAGFNVGSAQAVSRRLIEITYFDEAVEQEERLRAAEFEAVIWKDVEKALQDDPESLSVRRKARDAHIQGGRQTGALSLFGRIRKLPSVDVIPEIVKPENARLLAHFPRAPIENQRGHILAELLRTRASAQIQQEETQQQVDAVTSVKTSNAVITAGWLVALRDPTALWLFTEHERNLIGRFLDDYDTAREVLLSFGVLKLPPGPSLSTEADPVIVHQMILQSSADGTKRLEASSAERYRQKLSVLSDEARSSFMVIVFCLRIMIWKKTLSSIYGAEYLDRVLRAVEGTHWPKSTADTVARMEALFDLSLSDDPHAQGFHNVLVAGFVLDILDSEGPEVRTDHFVQGCAQIFQSELFHFPHYVRFLIAFMIHGEAGADRAYSEDGLG